MLFETRATSKLIAVVKATISFFQLPGAKSGELVKIKRFDYCTTRSTLSVCVEKETSSGLHFRFA